MNKNFWITFFIGILGLFSAYSYPNFEDNPNFDERVRALMAPHLLPLDHPAKPMLDLIFSKSRVTESQQNLTDAGFTIISTVSGSFVIVAKHPAIPGYVIKLYLDSEVRDKPGMTKQEWLTQRCIGASKIRNLIRKKKMRHFTVPDKWLYVLPLEPISRGPNPQPVILIATDMKLESHEITKFAWKNHIKSQHLKELYAILKKGYGSTGLIKNIPYTKNKMFAFVDTEYINRKHNLIKLKRYLSEEMNRKWESLIYE